MERTTKKENYDVLIYMSDQHAADCCGFMGDRIARTPNLDSIAKQGVVFERAYTSCPLCVPARASFLTSRMPSNIGVFNNSSELMAQEPTFAHLHAVKGYETNLIGRMHMVGMDYYHGFTRRLGMDISNSYWGFNASKREDWGDFGRSIAQKHCLELIGSGNSPVLEYDREVVAQALDFLEEDSEKPNLTVVGTYGPHFPYICDGGKMEYYEKILKEHYQKETYRFGESPARRKIQDAPDQDVIRLRAAYYAMIENMDEQIGQVYDAYQQYLKRNGKKGIFIYMSDHGDQIGYHQMYGKQTFFEKSVKIPLLIQMDGLGSKRVKEAVSIMDVGPTLCEINGTEPYPVQDGRSFYDLLMSEGTRPRYVISEFYDMMDEKPLIGYMVYQSPYKLITYKGFEAYDLLFNVTDDPLERHNLTASYREQYRNLHRLLAGDDRIRDWGFLFAENNKKYQLLDRFGREHIDLNRYTYLVPECARVAEESAKREPRS